MLRSRFHFVVLLVASLVLACAPSGKTQTMPDTATADTVMKDGPGRKRIALTYDDAPRGDGAIFSGPARTQALLNAWDAADTGPVAIFVTTQGLDRHEGRARIQAYAAAGHLIANHSHSHPWASRTDTVAYIADIDRAETELDSFANRRDWFRFPFLDEGGRGEAGPALAKRDALRAALKARGLISGYVTVDTYDWHMERLWQQAVRDGRSVDRAALSRIYSDMVVEAANHYDAMSIAVLGRRPAQVLLLHENDLAAAFTVDMVAALRADGWTIIDPDTAFADPIADHLPDTRFSGMGRIAAIARDAGLSGAETFDHWSASEAGIESRMDVAGVFSD